MNVQTNDNNYRETLVTAVVLHGCSKHSYNMLRYLCKKASVKTGQTLLTVHLYISSISLIVKLFL